MPAATNMDGPAPNCSGHRCNNCGAYVIGRYSLTTVNGCNNFYRASSLSETYAVDLSRQVPCRQQVLTQCPACDPSTWASFNDWLWAIQSGTPMSRLIWVAPVPQTAKFAVDPCGCVACKR